MKRSEVVGKRFGMRRVISFSHSQNGNSHWNVVCDCGNKHVAPLPSLKASSTCFECGTERRAKKRVTHGFSRIGSPEYQSWCSMRDRCRNKNGRVWHWYGGRGIRVCERWQKFENFLADMGERPEGKTLDRIDVNGNYEPSNCRWATWHEQRINQRRHLSRPNPEH